MSDSWKFMISFSDRFAVINEIAEALTEKHGVAHGEAIATAQALDSDCLSRASSMEEYTHLWHEELASITGSTTAAANLPTFGRAYSPDDDDTSSPSEKSSIGPYIHPTYHTSGLTSAIYKATLPIDHHTASNPANFPTKPGLTVALKTTNPATLQPPHNCYSEEKIIKAILPHPHIIPLLETFTCQGTVGELSMFVLVFPFCQSTLVHLTPRPSEKLCLHILKGALSGLAHLHKHGVIHRDIKPSNILLYSSGGFEDSTDGTSFPHVYLADFGISWSQATHSANSVEPPKKKITDIGTTHYRAIELLFGYTEYEVEVDLWALGCVVAECFMNMSKSASVGNSTGEWKSLFDAGDLGSELRLIGSIFQTLGTPTEESWPGSAKLPDFGKIQFRDFPRKNWEEVIPGAPQHALQLIDSLVKYEGTERISAEEALKSPLFLEV